MSEVTLTADNFETEVLKSEIPVLVDFWAPWCGPCRMIGPVVTKLAGEFAGKIKVCKLNVDDNQVLSQQYGVMSIPTLKIFKNGQVVEDMVGAMPEGTLHDKLTYYTGV
jgi:thioredoxin 1